ncbi:MAG: hypothetical protein ACJAV2_002594 [Myxococcota bacterium]
MGQSQTEQSLIWYPGDGIDTTFTDVLNLRVDDITPPFYTVGLGYYIEDDHMNEPALRGVHLPCDHDLTGRTASMLLTLGTAGIPITTAGELSQQAVTKVGPVLRPKVLVILDDGHHGESPEDAERIRRWLANDGNNGSVDYLRKPSDGVSAASLTEHDVVWFRNPGYPMDDRKTFESLLAFSSTGGDLVLQGDDMSWSFRNAWSMAPLTHLDWHDNGIRECGGLVHNDKHDMYSVTLLADHPMLNGINGSTVFYGDDIDFTRPRVERRSGSGGYLALEVLATDSLGKAVSCQDGSLEIDVQVAGDDGVSASLSSESYTIVCDDSHTGDLAIVVDNSGSESGFLPWLQQGPRSMVGEVIDRGGRASITRVSTISTVEQTLTGGATVLDSAIDHGFVTNGWTALYDGVRMGNEPLGGAVQDAAEADRAESLDVCCAGNRTLGIVAFTDGANNNSANEQDTSYADDGMDTTFDDLKNLRVGRTTTPIYTIGLGRHVVTDELAGLADETGGRYLQIDNAEQLPHVLDIIGDYFDTSHEVCVALPEQECGTFTLRLSTTWT